MKYKKGDIVGVCGDAMYEFRITLYSKKYKLYRGRCLKSYMKGVKVGELRSFRASQIVVKLGTNGKYFDPVILK